jgi:hypothetical protein
MMKMKEMVTIRTDFDVKKNIDDIVRLIIEEAQKISPKDKADVVAEILKRTSLYAALQLRIIIEVYDLPIECIAWISRNLFEMNLIMEYSIQYPEKAKEFALQKGSDEKDILEGLLMLNVSNSEINVTSISYRISHLDSILSKHRKNNLKHFTVKEMAFRVGMEEDYKAFFKFYSKYVHPTAWLIFATEEEKANVDYNNIFLIQAQYYSSRILKICEDWQKI